MPTDPEDRPVDDIAGSLSPAAFRAIAFSVCRGVLEGGVKVPGAPRSEFLDLDIHFRVALGGMAPSAEHIDGVEDVVHKMTEALRWHAFAIHVGVPQNAVRIEATPGNGIFSEVVTVVVQAPVSGFTKIPIPSRHSPWLTEERRRFAGLCAVWREHFNETAPPPARRITVNSEFVEGPKAPVVRVMYPGIPNGQNLPKTQDEKKRTDG